MMAIYDPTKRIEPDPEVLFLRSENFRLQVELNELRAELDRVRRGFTSSKANGKLGGKARAMKLSKSKRSEIARKAAKARWGK